MTDVRTIIRERFLAMVKHVNPDGGWKVLIIDEESTKIISAALSMYDIMDENVSLVEGLEKKRRKMPKSDALYFLTPTEASIDLLNEDWKDRSEPQYRAIHLFFSTRVPEVLTEKISKHVQARLVQVGELHLDFYAPEARFFHFDMPLTIPAIYADGESADSTRAFRAMAKKLFTVCHSLNENPYVRYAQKSDLCVSFASLLQDQLDQIAERDENEEVLFVPAAPAERATVLILERGQDLLSVLVHEFTYQAMAYDLLPIEGWNFKFAYTDNDGETQERVAQLVETDQVWVKLRHSHIAETCDTVIEEFNQFLSANKSVSTIDNRGKVDSLSAMTEALKAMPQYQDMKKKYSLHMEMASQCMDKFDQNGLATVAGIEQDIVCGEDVLGKPVPRKTIISRIRAVCEDPKYLATDKLRLLLLAQLAGHLRAEERRELSQLSRLDEDLKQCLYKIQRLVTEDLKYDKPKENKKSKSKKRPDDVPYELSRYQPTLKTLLKDLSEDALSWDLFPYLKDAPPRTSTSTSAITGAKSLKAGGRTKAASPAWTQDNLSKAKDPNQREELSGGRLIVFILGGITFSELRTCYEAATAIKRDVIIGASYFLTPTMFLDHVKRL